MSLIRRYAEAARREIAIFLVALDPMPVVIFVVAGLSLWAYHYYGGNAFWDQVLDRRVSLLTHWPSPTRALARCCYWSWTAFVLFLLVPQAAVAITARATKTRRPALGFGSGKARLGLGYALLFYVVMLAPLLFVVRTADFQAHYPSCAAASRSWSFFVVYEIHYALFFCWWEYFFRGFLTLGLEKTFGFWTIFVQMLPFVVMHFDKPSLEAMSSVFGGLALGYVALRTRSFWYGAGIHAGVAVTLDVLAMLTRGSIPH